MIFVRGSLVLMAAWLAATTHLAAAEEQPAELPPMPEPLGEPPAAAAHITESVSVELDLASVVRIPAGTDTLALGNPAIADVTQPRAGSFAVITGKSYGTTNMLALGRDGEILHDMTIHVSAPRAKTLTVLRGTARETWSCIPQCEPTVTLGDTPDYFGGTSGQIGGRNDLASKR